MKKHWLNTRNSDYFDVNPHKWLGWHPIKVLTIKSPSLGWVLKGIIKCILYIERERYGISHYIHNLNPDF